MTNATVPGYSPETQQIMTHYWGDINAVMNAWVECEKALDAAKSTEMRLRKAIFEVKFPNPSLGTQRAELGNGFNLKAVYNLNYKLNNKNGETEAVQDEIAKMGNEGTFIADRLVKWSPELSITEYKKLAPEYKAVIDKVLTTTPAAPALEIEAPKQT